MQRDIHLLIERLSRSYYVSGRNVFMGPLGEDFMKLFGDVSETIPELNPFAGKVGKSDVTIAGFRNCCEDEIEAVRDAWLRLDGILDACSFLTEEHRPKVSGVVMIREGARADAALKTYIPSGWARWEPAPEAAKQVWRKRNARVADYVMGFINAVAFAESTATTELTRQLAYSMKMFRRGILSGCPGIEYLCKFSALEGLVCGPRFTSKAATLKKNLSALFGRWNQQIELEVRRLWVQRCKASHQALAFDAKLIGDLPTLDLWVLGTVVFALDHISTATTTAELWPHARSYTLPAFVRTERPPGFVRLGFRDGLIDYSVRLKGIGPISDRSFAESLTLIERCS